MTDAGLVDSVARECRIAPRSVAAALSLLEGGATVPFVARYRKEATGGLDEVALRTISERFKYLSELEARRTFVRDAISSQGKLTREIEAALSSCSSKAELEDLYAPFKSKRKTRGQIAKELGLEPLATSIWNRKGTTTPEAQAAALVAARSEIGSIEAAVDGAIDICAERIAIDPRVRQRVREHLGRAVIRVKKAPKHRKEKTKFDNYEDYGEPVTRIAPHRYLAVSRGEEEGILKVAFEIDEPKLEAELAQLLAVRGNDPWTKLFRRALDEALSRLLVPSARSSIRTELGQKAELSAVQVFAKNLEKLLLASPYGARWVLGIDPGQRTGCKCAVVDETGALVEHTLFNLVQGESAERAAEQTLSRLIARHPIEAIAVGNGTHGRETEAFVRATLKKLGKSGVLTVSVNEAGASVYSASEIARQELPEHDVTVRGAVSIARRLQDPLAELVKIDPKSVGVGQYQHDVSESLLSEKLGEVVESCVNRVGVELNTASASLLAYVSGIGEKLAHRIVEHRTESGKFRSRAELKRVSGLGAKTFEQAAGFLRIRGATHPLDASAVHPERYGLVERMAQDAGVKLGELVANREALARIDRKKYLSEEVGGYTLDDIFSELEKPGRDPRAEFEAPSFREDVRTLEDVRSGMVLEGRVTNVTAFGAFVDIGVHQDGLVHISELADRFVKDPNEVVGVGDLIRVRVLGVDLDRKRISLSAKKLGV